MPRYFFTITPTKFAKNRLVISSKQYTNLIFRTWEKTADPREVRKVLVPDPEQRRKNIKELKKRIRNKEIRPFFQMGYKKDLLIGSERSDVRFEIPKRIREKFRLRPNKPIRISIRIPDEFTSAVGSFLRKHWETVKHKGMQREIFFKREDSADFYFETKDGKFISQRDVLLNIVKDEVRKTAVAMRRRRMLFFYTKLIFKIIKKKGLIDLEMGFGQENIELQHEKWKELLNLLINDLEADFWRAFAKEESEEYTEVWLRSLYMGGFRMTED